MQWHEVLMTNGMKKQIMMKAKVDEGELGAFLDFVNVDMCEESRKELAAALEASMRRHIGNSPMEDDEWEGMEFRDRRTGVLHVFDLNYFIMEEDEAMGLFSYNVSIYHVDGGETCIETCTGLFCTFFRGVL